MHIQNEKIYMLIVEFGLDTPNPLRFPLYAPERVCKIVPQAGDEIDAIIWLLRPYHRLDPQLPEAGISRPRAAAPLLRNDAERSPAVSMHEIEDYIEEAIRVVSRSDMPVSEKRSMIYSLLRLEEYGDCGFTNLRTLKEMMDCQYTFVFDKTEMYDYEANRGYYDDLSKKGGCSQGAPYTLVARDAVTNEWVKHGDKVCIDSGSDAWRGMVAAGAIAGEGAAPVERLENLDVLRKVKKLWGPMDDYFMQAHGGLFLLSGAIDDLPEEEFPEHFGMTKQDFEDEYGD